MSVAGDPSNVRSAAEPLRFAEIAVPLPLPGPLTYEIPERFLGLAQAGCRARVRVGGRRVVGMILGRVGAPPVGVETRPLDAVVDLSPVLPPELLGLAGFVADYYVAPIGEVVRAMLPSGTAPWGERRVRLTDAGALASPRSPVAARLRERLLESRNGLRG